MGCVHLLCREQSVMTRGKGLARVRYGGRPMRAGGVQSIPETELGGEKHPLRGFDEPHAYTEGVCLLVWPAPSLEEPLPFLMTPAFSLCHL